MSSNPPQENCCAKVVLHEGEPKGKIQKICDLNCYVTANYTDESTKYLIIFSDIYGLDLVNTKLVADTFSSCLGYPVIIMDILNNDPFVADGSMDFQKWFSNHTPEITVSIIKPFMEKFTSTHKIEFLSGVGYCFGAKYLAHYLTIDGPINVGAFAHPSFVSDEELENIKKPLLISCAEIDEIFTDELRSKSKQILQKSGIPYQIDLFSNTQHGYSVRGDLSIPQIKYAAEKTLTDQVLWFNFHDQTAKKSCC